MGPHTHTRHEPRGATEGGGAVGLSPVGEQPRAEGVDARLAAGGGLHLLAQLLRGGANHRLELRLVGDVDGEAVGVGRQAVRHH